MVQKPPERTTGRTEGATDESQQPPRTDAQSLLLLEIAAPRHNRRDQQAEYLHNKCDGTEYLEIRSLLQK